MVRYDIVDSNAPSYSNHFSNIEFIKPIESGGWKQEMDTPLLIKPEKELFFCIMKIFSVKNLSNAKVRWHSFQGRGHCIGTRPAVASGRGGVALLTSQQGSHCCHLSLSLMCFKTRMRQTTGLRVSKQSPRNLELISDKNLSLSLIWHKFFSNTGHSFILTTEIE